MERSFQILAVILIGVAAFFLWKGNSDAGFVAAVLACVSFLISTRFPVKERVEKRNSKIQQKQIEEAEMESLVENAPELKTEEVEIEK